MAQQHERRVVTPLVLFVLVKLFLCADIDHLHPIYPYGEGLTFR